MALFRAQNPHPRHESTDQNDAEAHPTGMRFIGSTLKAAFRLPSNAVKCRSFINLNVSGVRFIMPIDVAPRPPIDRSILHRMAAADHSTRLTMCNAFFEHTQEYFFARCAHLFSPVLAHYLTGHLHIPADACKWEVKAELDYWRVPEHVIAMCCHKKLPDQAEFVLKVKNDVQVELDAATKEGRLRSAFENVRFGRLRIQMYRLLEQPTSSIMARVLATFSVTMILVSFGVMVCASMHEFCPKMEMEVMVVVDDDSAVGPGCAGSPVDTCPAWISIVNQCCILWFTVELVLRCAVAADKLRFLRSPLNMIDLLAILPYYIELAVEYSGSSPLDDTKDTVCASLPQWHVLNQILLSLRTLRVLRVLKLARYSNGLRKFGKVMRKSRMQLLTAGITGVVVVMLSSTMVYYVEKDTPNTQFINIPTAMWWYVFENLILIFRALITMSSVGYGDLVPVTILGRLIASGTVVVGVMVLALPVSILVQNFTEQIEDEERER